MVKRIALALVLGMVLLGMPTERAHGQDKVSRPGQYAGYVEPLYDEWARSSQYVAVRDGTRLAVDVFRPAKNGSAVAERLPVIWSLNRYHRAEVRSGALTTILDSAPWLKTLLRYGYVIAVADARGTGASFGWRAAEFSLQDARDAFDLTMWLAAQPWSDGNIGMFGESWMGANQMLTASLAPPPLKAIVPQVAPLDRYAAYYPGGIFMERGAAEWSRTVQTMDAAPAAPVDADPDGSRLAQAVAEHRGNADFYQAAEAAQYRDDALWQEGNAANHLDAISRSGVAIYQIGGWFDPYRSGALFAFANLENPRKVLIGPWTHDRVGEHFDLGIEHVRWYDYWLKGIDNRIMTEPPLYYATLGQPEKDAWQFAAAWPLPSARATPYYLRAGVLDLVPPGDAAGHDNYTVNYTTTTQKGTRWNDDRGMTYTTMPLAAGLGITGHPVVRLWVTATAPEVDLFVYLEKVTANGTSQYLTEGNLRASQRTLAPAPFDNFGLPYQRRFAGDAVDLPRSEPVELVFDLLPVSVAFDAGQRIRVTIVNADAGNARTPVLLPPPVVSIYRDARHPSHIILPVAWMAASVAAQGTDTTIAAALGLAAILAAIGIILFFGKRILAQVEGA